MLRGMAEGTGKKQPDFPRTLDSSPRGNDDRNRFYASTYFPPKQSHHPSICL
jgi:hypothetical protein